MCHNTIDCIVTGGRLGRWLCRDTMLRHGRAYATIPSGGARHGRGGCDTRSNSACGRAATRRATQRRARPATRPRERLRYGRGRPAIRRLVRHDTAGPKHIVRAGWVRVCALYTRLSFDSVHCSESLFRDTVHEHCSRGFQKKYFFF